MNKPNGNTCRNPACCLTNDGQAIAFDFGPAKHRSPIDWFVLR